MKNIEKVSQEIQVAREKYGPFNSTHELYGVLSEELDEFWDQVKKKNSDHSMFDLPIMDQHVKDKKNAMIHELMQIAAIALRGMAELENDEIKWV
jgi:hypothetical protein